MPLISDHHVLGAVHAYLDQGRFRQSDFDFAISLANILVIALVPIIVGVLACLRYVWAMIVGTALWSLFFGFVVVDGGFSKLPEHKFEVASIAVLALLTVAAVAWLLLGLIASVGIAHAMYDAIELPAIRLSHRFKPGRGGQAANTPSADSRQRGVSGQLAPGLAS